MKLVFLKTAQIELDEAADYYTEHASLSVAEAFLLDVKHAHQRLVERPEIGPSLTRRLRILHLRHSRIRSFTSFPPIASSSTLSPISAADRAIGKGGAERHDQAGVDFQGMNNAAHQYPHYLCSSMKS